MECPICGTDMGKGESSYPNRVCNICDLRAVNEEGEEPWHGRPPDEKSEELTTYVPSNSGENPVFIDGQKCWRRYRFGGWVTMVDEQDCESLERFYETHG